jgi:hypothetical protein
MEWLNHPEQAITKEDVQHVCKDIKAAKKELPPPQFSEQDFKVMRSEVKDLFKTFKERRKSQKKQKKEARRERRAARRIEKKERRTARREARRGKKAERMRDSGGRAGYPWTPGSTFGPNQPPPPTPANTIPSLALPTSTPTNMPGFPFGRAASVPFMKGPPFGRGPHAGPFGLQAMHGGWPFTQGLPYAPGRISAPNDMSYPTPISNSAEDIHLQALQMEEAAKWKESRAIDLRTAATDRKIGGKQRLKNLDEATQLEEAAEECRIEADRLRAEALHLDGELARELEEDGRQASGIVQN